MADPFDIPIDTPVEKVGGSYGGPGIVRGRAATEVGAPRYLVGHRIEGGYGEFLHVYPRDMLRTRDPKDDDPGAAMLALPAVRDVLAERRRQISLGYTPAHDDAHSDGEIISADWGALARLSGQAFEARRVDRDMRAYRRLLVEGAAMVLAEIERVDRETAHG